MNAPTIEKNLWPRIFYFISGLLYPGALGAAITWFVLAASAVIRQEPNQPSLSAFFLALWFTVYHCLLFVRLMDRHDNWCSDANNDNYKDKAYGWRGLLSDVIYSIGLFSAFVALDFSNGGISACEFGFAFLAAIGVPLSAIVAHWEFTTTSDKYKLKRRVLIILCLAVAIIGACFNFMTTITLSNLVTQWSVGVLWVFLIYYVLFIYRYES